MGSESYQKYKELLLKLHDLVAQDKDQTDEADIIRDAMDAPGTRLTDEEHERIKGLSADLYMLVGEEIKERSPLSEKEIRDVLARQFKANDSDGILESLRKYNYESQDEHLACIRAICWEALGDFDVALLFARHALKLNPSDPYYRLLMLHIQLKLQQQVDPEELATAAVEAGYFGPDTAKQIETVRDYSFSPKEFHLKSA